MKLNDTQRLILAELQKGAGHGYVYELSEPWNSMAKEAWLEADNNRQMVADHLGCSIMSLEYGEVPTDFYDDVVEWMIPALEEIKQSEK